MRNASSLRKDTATAQARDQVLPSAIEICLAERQTATRAKKLARDRVFIRELREQAENDLGVFPYVDALDCSDPLDPNEFIVYASNDLSPFMVDGKCSCAACRQDYAATFARGVCLYADVVVIADHFSGAILSTPPSAWLPDEFANQIEILACLEPLMRSGAIRFSRWSYTRCKACGDVARAAERDVARRLLHEIFGSELSVEYGTVDEVPVLSVSSPILVGPQGPVVLRVPTTKTFEKTLLQAARFASKNDGTHPSFRKKLESHLTPRLLPELQRFVDAAIFSTMMGRMCNATVATDSALGSRVLSYLDGLDGVQPVAKQWSLPPTSDLPWLNDLTAEGVVEVRQEARSALPAFRSLVRSRAFAGDENRASMLDDLRAQASEVEGELRSLRVVRRRSALLSISGLAFALCGFGTRDPSLIATGLAGFLSTLAAAHQVNSEADLREHSLIHKPAQLLISAKSSIHRQSRKSRGEA